MTDPTPATQVPAEDIARAAGPADHDETIVEVLAAKVLLDWLRNRQQLLVPFRIELQKLEPRLVETLMHAIIAAAQADGATEGKDRDRVRGALQAVGAGPAQDERVDAALGHARTLPQVLEAVKDVQTGAMVYAVSLLAIDRRKLVNRHYLRYLAARMQLPKDLTRSLEQRFYLSVE